MSNQSLKCECVCSLVFVRVRLPHRCAVLHHGVVELVALGSAPREEAALAHVVVEMLQAAIPGERWGEDSGRWKSQTGDELGSKNRVCVAFLWPRCVRVCLCVATWRAVISRRHSHSLPCEHGRSHTLHARYARSVTDTVRAWRQLARMSASAAGATSPFNG